MIKSDLRRAFLDRRRSLTDSERSSKSRQISDRLFERIDLEAVAYLHCYIAIAKFNEIDTSIIFRRLWSDHPQIRTVVPKLNNSTGKLDNLLLDENADLITNSWGIAEPAHDQHVHAESLDVVLVPLLCFDVCGHRVGYGKGYYDKLLGSCRSDCLKAGLSCFPPVSTIDDVTEYDIPLDICITPDAVYRFE